MYVHIAVTIVFIVQDGFQVMAILLPLSPKYCDDRYELHSDTSALCSFIRILLILFDASSFNAGIAMSDWKNPISPGLCQEPLKEGQQGSYGSS